MSDTAASTAQVVILPSNYTKVNPPETFQDSSRGLLSWHTLFSKGLTATDGMTASVAICPTHSGRFCRHHHPQAEIYYVLEGTATVFVLGKEYEVGNGSAIFIPGGVEHGVINQTDQECRWFYVYATSS